MHLRQFKIFSCSLILISVVILGGSHQAQAACTAKLSLALQNYEAQPLTKTRFYIYEQVRYGNLTVPGKKLGTGTTDQYLGAGDAEWELMPDVENYALMVENPTLKGADFWYFNGIHATCDSSLNTQKRLTAMRVRVRNTSGELQRNLRFTVYSQKYDANNAPIIDQSLGTADTDDSGQAIVYLPTKEQSLNSLNYYALGFKGDNGVYYKYNIMPVADTLNAIDYILSDVQIIARDTETSDPIPNFKIDVYEQKANLEIGNLIMRVTTDNQGMAYFQAQPGTYILQYEEANRSDKSFYNVIVNEGKRTSAYVNVDRANVGKCTIQSALHLALRDWNENLISNLSVTLYQQVTDNNSQAIPGQRVGHSTIDSHGSGKLDFYPLPAERYLLKVCDQNENLGCFWYRDLQFGCNSELNFEEHVNSVVLVLRNNKKALAVGQRFKLYGKSLNVDQQLAIDKNKLIGNFTVPVDGKFVIYLSSQDMLNAQQDYLLVIDQSSQIQLVDDFRVSDTAVTKLEYAISGNKLLDISPKPVVDASLSKRLAGRILLQVEQRGEAWYINPTDSKRYYLGRPEDAFGVMKRLSVGISNNDLKRIRLNFDLIQGDDSDADGLPDALEKGLGSDPYRSDSDEDGFSDFDEVKGGYNYLGGGSLPLSNSFAQAQSGKILLQVEGNGEAWYVSPLNNQRYYLNRPKDAYTIMRALGLGITNADLNKIPIGNL
jgi:hypothetical protein